MQALTHQNLVSMSKTLAAGPLRRCRMKTEASWTYCLRHMTWMQNKRNAYVTKGKTILVVDDEVKITEVVKSYLENAGYTAVCAFNGVQALKLFDTCEPSLVILDLMLPDMSGED